MAYVTRRAGQAVFTFFAVVNIAFFLLRAMPGGPLQYIKARAAQAAMQGQQVNQEQMVALAKQYLNIQPDQPLHIQWWNYVTSVMTGDLGTSLTYGESVSAVLAEALPWTIFVMSISIVLTFVLGIFFGAVMAFVEGSKFDTGSTVLFTGLNSIPYFVMALVFLWAFAYEISLFPTSGRYSSDVRAGVNIAFLLSAAYHATLPILSSVIGFGGLALSMRGNSISVLGSDYLRVARLRGLPSRRIATRYIARNAILPMYTGFLIRIGTLFGGSVILERIFVYPGVGFRMFEGLSARDYSLVMGGFLIITAAVITGIFIADLTYGRLDPRINKGDQNV